MLKERTVAIMLSLCLAGSVFLPAAAKALGEYPVGGRFAPGLFDIFTPSLCGPLVTVIDAKTGVPGIYIWGATLIYRHFGETPWHVGTNMLGLATPPLGVCPPVLYMLGSSLTP